MNVAARGRWRARVDAWAELLGEACTLLIGYVFCGLGFIVMLLLWNDGISYWKVALGYMMVGIGVGFAGTPASHSLTGSVPVTRAGIASGGLAPLKAGHEQERRRRRETGHRKHVRRLQRDVLPP